VIVIRTDALSDGNDLKLRAAPLAILQPALRYSVLTLVAVIPIENAAYLGPFSLSRVAAAAAFLFFILMVCAGGQILWEPRLSVFMLLFLAWVGLSYFWSFSQPETLVYLFTMTQLAILVLLIWQIVPNEGSLRSVLGALALGGGTGGVLSLLNSVSAQNGVPRYAIGDPNDFGIALAVCLVASTHMAQTSRKIDGTVLWSATALLEFIAILRTASRAAAVAVVVAALVLLLSHRSALMTRRSGASVLLAALTVASFDRFFGGGSLTRLASTVPSIAAGDFNDRTRYWRLAIGYWDSSPYQGIGGGAFKARSSVDGGGKVAHSVVFGLLAEVGLIGLVLFGVILLLSLVSVARLREHRLQVSLYAMALCWFCGALTLTMETRKLTWLIIALWSAYKLRAVDTGLRPPEDETR